jgi:FkbM family methyltransferase
MSIASALRFRRLVLRECGEPKRRAQSASLQLKRPFRGRVILRSPSSDILTFNEVMIAEIYRGIIRRVPRCEFVMDLGANIGLATLYFAAAFPQCKVLCVEPDAENQKVLMSNVRILTEENRCKTIHGAAWSTNGTLQVDCPCDSSGFNAVRVSQVPGGTSRQVDAYSVNELMKLAGFPRIDVLKVDIEGAETELFRCNAAWLDYVNAITIEFHGNSRIESGFDDVVRAKGFDIENDRFPNTVLAVRRASTWRS